MALAIVFERLWNAANSSNPAPSVFEFLRQHGGADSDQLLAVLLYDQQRRWLTDHPLKVEDYLASLPDLQAVEIGQIFWFDRVENFRNLP